MGAVRIWVSGCTGFWGVRPSCAVVAVWVVMGLVVWPSWGLVRFGRLVVGLFGRGVIGLVVRGAVRVDRLPGLVPQVVLSVPGSFLSQS